MHIETYVTRESAPHRNQVVNEHFIFIILNTSLYASCAEHKSIASRQALSQTIKKASCARGDLVSVAFALLINTNVFVERAEYKNVYVSQRVCSDIRAESALEIPSTDTARFKSVTRPLSTNSFAVKALKL
jgi:hypothetical protein